MIKDAYPAAQADPIPLEGIEQSPDEDSCFIEGYEMQNPTISLCMIVKNEARNLPRCLESVKGQVDEIVIVDTGSDDGTLDVAARYGAKCLTTAWNNDFSAARNVSLEHASGEWILWLDADEELLPPPYGITLRQLATEAQGGAFLVPIENVLPDGKSSVHCAVRFFRKFDGIRFEGKAHEHVGNWLLRHRIPLDRSPVAIRHWGYATSKDLLVQKLDRNLKLLEEQVSQNPRESFAHYCLGMTFLAKNEFDRSLRHFERALELGPPTDNLESLVLNMLSFHQLHRRKYLEAERLARRSLETTPEQHTARLFLGLAFYHQHDYARALPLLAGAYQFQRLPFERRRSDLSLEQYYDEAELVWVVAHSAYEVGRYSLAHQFLQRLTRLVQPPNATIMVLSGLCAVALGAFKEAVSCFDEARRLGAPWSDMGAPWVHALIHSGLLDQALSILQDSGLEFFDHPQAENVFGLLVERHFQADLVQPLVRVLARLANGEGSPIVLLDALAICWIKLQKFGEAARVLENLLARDGDNREVQRRLAAVYARMGREDMVARVLQSGMLSTAAHR